MVEQYMYTGGGYTRWRAGRVGDFGHWAMSQGIEFFRESMKEIITRASKGQYKENWGEVKRLKPGAKANRKGEYKEKYYEKVREITQPAIKVLEGVQEGWIPTQKDVELEKDYRHDPSKAPYRIIASQLADGTLIVARLTGVNKYYGVGFDGSRDYRDGNYFAHAYIFPAGTKLEDIPVSQLPFKMGLDIQNDEDIIKAPDLEAIPLEELIRRAQQQSPQNNQQKQVQNDQLMTQKELVELVYQCVEGESQKLRNEANKILKQQIKLGADVMSLLLTISNDAKKLAISKEDWDIEESMMDHLESMIPYQSVFENVANILKLGRDAEYNKSAILTQIQQSVKEDQLPALLSTAEKKRDYLQNLVKIYATNGKKLSAEEELELKTARFLMSVTKKLVETTIEPER